MAKKAKPPKDDISASARELILQAYEQILTRYARLDSFASASVLPELSDAADRQSQLAKEDLVVLAIYVRHAVENAGLYKDFKKRTFTPLPAPDKTSASIIDTLNTIIHHRFIEIWRRESDYSRNKLDDEKAMMAFMQNYRKGIAPAVIVMSDRGSMIGFRLSSFLEAIATEIVQPLVEYCEERELYLEYVYRI